MKNIKNKMKQTLLNSLVGMTVKDAKKTALAAGHKVLVLSSGTVSIALAVSNTVKIYHDANKIVTKARAGDPLEVV